MATLDRPCITEDAETPSTYRFTAPAWPGTARVAREFVAAALVANGHDALAENACVCVSDVVSNVVRHARVTSLAVEVAVHRDHVIVGVSDTDPGRLPWRRKVSADSEGGRGLMLVRRLSEASGVAWEWDGLTLVGKRVWFELRGSAVG
ncbi:ATP-binding protein [Streptomyces albireticuli]|uniref:ATP-binding protein n=1 Tax=Streptomyces albireticuli TaxID=1940 RepID=UPI00369D2988